MHPTLNGSYLSFCGFHAPRCIKEYGRKGKKDQPCPPLERLNAFGMCRNHLEAHLSTLNYEERDACVLVDSDFDVPGIKECKHDPSVVVISRHPLAPRHPPPQDTTALDGAIPYALPDAIVLAPRASLAKRILALAGAFVKSQVVAIVSAVLDSPNPASMVLKELVWQIQFLRRAEVVAIRIQRIFRGNRARKRVWALRYEQAALRRIRACQTLQTYARGYLGRQRFLREFDAVHRAVPTIQRIMRGGLARKRCRELRAAIRLQRNYRCYRQRLLAWAVREEIAYMKALQHQADENLREMEEKLETFRRLRARRLLRAQMLRWKRQKAARALERSLRLRMLWSAVKIQRQWRRHRYYETVKRRYRSAQCIQKRVRGWLTRHMWREDPGILSVVGFVSTRSGCEYGKVVVLAQPSHSYSCPSRRARMRVGAVTIQRLFRGYLGRLRANEQWLNMVRRWEWIGIESTDSSGKSSDSMAVGKERYGFVVPSFGYHADERLHMKPIVRDIKAARGFAYEYQYILDLIKDRDGLRAWSLTHEQREQRKRAQQLQRAKVSPSVAAVASSTKPPRVERRSPPKSDCISLSKALFPVGSTVRVAVFNTAKKGKAFHPAKVLRINDEVEGVKDRTTFEVEYEPALVTVHGVRIYKEGRVRASRLEAITRADLAEPPLERRVSVGRQLQIAINRLKAELRAAKRAKEPGSPIPSDVEHERTLTSVDELVERLCDDRQGFDLLADDCKLVNFVFRNSTFLATTWLQVVERVRLGTHQRAGPSSIEGTSATGTPDFYATKFGFVQQTRVDTTQRMKMLSERASIIEKRMTELGFQRAIEARVSRDRQDALRSPHENQLRPETTQDRSQARSADIIQSRFSRDDLALKDVDGRLHSVSSGSSVAVTWTDATVFSYLRRRSRESVAAKISLRSLLGTRYLLRVVVEQLEGSSASASENETRAQRATGGGDAARGPVHARVLAATEPLEPRGECAISPHGRVLPLQPGRVRASRVPHPAGAEQVRGLDDSQVTQLVSEAHMNQVHHTAAGATPSLQVEDSSTDRPESQRCPVAVSLQVIWLGPYSVAWNLNDKLGVPRSSLELVVCPVHQKVSDASCSDCIRQQSCPILPCKLYSSVALTLRANASVPAVQSADAASDLSGYTIFSFEDPDFCPIVLERSLVCAKEQSERPRNGWHRADKRAVQSRSQQPGVDELVYVQIVALCRDSKNTDWIFGRAFHRSSPRAPAAANDGSRSANPGRNLGVVYEVAVDERLMFIKLTHVVGAARIWSGTSSVFHQKYACPNGADDEEARSAVESGAMRASGYVVEEVIWHRQVDIQAAIELRMKEHDDIIAISRREATTSTCMASFKPQASA
ncbi:hypothetical protein PybrP1_002788 [[Pythium] brassicae (nom. inval.)]|nr:hypothetical protein PybrP1_002788 [[Pythium] brassicae (nom. inval.)]